MKAFGILDYPVEDVFHIFIKNAKKDFSDFNEEDATGCKIKKNIASKGTTPGATSIECTVEITQYIKNEKYQITTSTEYAKYISTYTFKGQKDSKTKIELEEKHSYENFFSYISLYIHRFITRGNFKAKYENFLDTLNNQLRIYYNNIERSKPKNK